MFQPQNALIRLLQKDWISWCLQVLETCSQGWLYLLKLLPEEILSCQDFHHKLLDLEKLTTLIYAPHYDHHLAFWLPFLPLELSTTISVSTGLHSGGPSEDNRGGHENNCIWPDSKCNSSTFGWRLHCLLYYKEIQKMHRWRHLTNDPNLRWLWGKQQFWLEIQMTEMWSCWRQVVMMMGKIIDQSCTFSSHLKRFSNFQKLDLENLCLKTIQKH